MFKVLHHVQVNDGEVTPLHLAMFYISDPDTVTKNLYMTFVILPTNGDIVVAVDGKDTLVKASGNVTLSDLIEGKVRFRHHAGKSFKGKA